MSTSEIIFQIEPGLFVAEYAAQDEMHPSRTVNDTYVLDFRNGVHREESIGHNHYAYGLTLTREQAFARAAAYETRQGTQA